MASTESDYLRALYQGWIDRMGANPEMDLPTTRDVFEEWHLPTREPEGVGYAEVDAGGVEALWCIPDGSASDRILLFFHGGGCVVGSMHTHRKLAGHLAKAAGARALVLNFKLAPEHPYPSQINEGITAYRWLLQAGISPGHIATIGDSAGGNLSIAVPLKLRDLALPLPGAVVPLSPWVDFEWTNESFQSRAESDAIYTTALWDVMVDTYLGGASRTDPLANPLLADLTGLPPMYVEAGDAEVLCGPSRDLAALAEKAGVDVTLHVEPDMQHVFEFLAGRAPEADRCVAAIGAWLRPKLGLG